ncbi:hypothetical protein [uncultured Pseudodesulfovibrio sp.]|uniref:hypothetical protein n=1 Tax=uncultured Pseudodesulfovibrio sp. TaxID=2035858 RepID=UPI0029C93251|nr:hypothetical protein [uncultured Pseudodesulfovibrio sp.]
MADDFSDPTDGVVLSERVADAADVFSFIFVFLKMEGFRGIGNAAFLCEREIPFYFFIYRGMLTAEPPFFSQ